MFGAYYFVNQFICENFYEKSKYLQENRSFSIQQKKKRILFFECSSMFWMVHKNGCGRCLFVPFIAKRFGQQPLVTSQWSCYYNNDNTNSDDGDNVDDHNNINKNATTTTTPCLLHRPCKSSNEMCALHKLLHKNSTNWNCKEDLRCLLSALGAHSV